jgi:hypothetical protein
VASSSASIALPVIAVGAAAVSVISYAAYISVTRHRELTSREAMTAILFPFIGPLVLEMSDGNKNTNRESKLDEFPLQKMMDPKEQIESSPSNVTKSDSDVQQSIGKDLR